MDFQNSFISINNELTRMKSLIQSLQNENKILKQEKTQKESGNFHKEKILLIKELLDYSRNNCMAANEFRESLFSILNE